MNDLQAPISYMARTRAYYLALGYNNPYEWAHFDEVPFTRLAQPLADSRITLITTAAPYQADKGPQGPRALADEDRREQCAEAGSHDLARPYDRLAGAGSCGRSVATDRPGRRPAGCQPARDPRRR